jgi:hypothetical protein
MRKCSVDGCNREYLAKNLCSRHYNRLRKYGNPLGEYIKPTDEERFWAKVNKTDSCWLWTGKPDAHGYGQFQSKISFYAHVYSYKLHGNNVPNGYEVDHKCWTPLCVNPEHLQAVTHAHNGQNRTGLAANNVSGYRGVYWANHAKKWVAQATINNKTKKIGYYDSAEEAGLAASKFRKTHMSNSLMDN